MGYGEHKDKSLTRCARPHSAAVMATSHRARARGVSVGLLLLMSAVLTACAGTAGPTESAARLGASLDEAANAIYRRGAENAARGRCAAAYTDLMCAGFVGPGYEQALHQAGVCALDPDTGIDRAVALDHLADAANAGLAIAQRDFAQALADDGAWNDAAYWLILFQRDQTSSIFTHEPANSELMSRIKQLDAQILASANTRADLFQRQPLETKNLPEQCSRRLGIDANTQRLLQEQRLRQNELIFPQ